MKRKKTVLIIIPAYNEENNIVKTINSIRNLEIKNYEIDYIVINDGSIDNTLLVLRDNKINHLNLINNLGIGAAMQTGYKYANYHNYDYAVQFDGDGQHNAKYISVLLKDLSDNNVDLSVGSRFVAQLSEFRSTKIRQFGIAFLSFLIKITCKETIKDVTSGFRMCNNDVISEFASSYPDDYPEPESLVVLLKKGYKINEVAVEMNEREHGVSSINKIKSIYYMIKVSIAIIFRSLSTKKGE